MKRFIITFWLINFIFADPISLKLSGSYYGRRGNLDYHYYDGSFSVSKYGTMKLGGLSLPDTEFLLAGDRAKSTYDGNPYEDDGSAILKVDLFANQKFSPFVFAEWEFDSLYALESRANIGLGGKYRFGPYFSVSYAALFEEEAYSNVDTSATLYRHSLRPKYKRYYENLGLFIDWQIFYKPRFDDNTKYLLKNIIVFSFQTFHEALTLDINYEYEYNSRYDLEKVAKSYNYSYDDSLGWYYNLEEYQDFYGMDPDFLYSVDSELDILKASEFYKPEDYTVSIGLTFSF